MRRLAPLALALVLVPLTVAGMLRLMAEPPPSVLPFPNATHRVAMALDEAMRAAMTAVNWTSDVELSPVQNFVAVAGAPGMPATAAVSLAAGPKPSDPLPDDTSGFWIQYIGSPVPSLMTLDHVTFQGKARDGRTIRATVKQDPFGEGSVVDFHGDTEAVRLLAGPIAAILARPGHVRDSPEDRAALSAYFSPMPARAPFRTATAPAPAPTPAPSPSPAVAPAQP